MPPQMPSRAHVRNCFALSTAGFSSRRLLVARWRWFRHRPHVPGLMRREMRVKKSTGLTPLRSVHQVSDDRGTVRRPHVITSMDERRRTSESARVARTAMTPVSPAADFEPPCYRRQACALVRRRLWRLHALLSATHIDAGKLIFAKPCPVALPEATFASTDKGARGKDGCGVSSR